MINNVIILGSTGSIGKSTLDSIKNQSNFKVKLLTSNNNVRKLFKQAVAFKVNDVIIQNEISYKKNLKIFKQNKINLHLGLNNIKKIINNKVSYCVNSITGIDGLEPTLDVIPFTKNLLVANKESVICGWNLIKKKLSTYNTNFIPLDSEHYSIMELIKNENSKNIERIVLTASGGPFLNKKKKDIINIEPKFALKHPNWKMGKKISIDSSNLMNKIFEFIEAKKIFNLSNNQISILIHPSSYVHAIVFFRGNIVKFLAHETNMIIPISNAFGIKKKLKINSFKKSVYQLNKLNFKSPDFKKFPLLSLIRMFPNKSSYFETILITLNDELVKKYLNGEINYISIQTNLLKHMKSQYFKKFYKLKPKSIYDIKKMIMLTKIYLEKKLIHNEN